MLVVVVHVQGVVVGRGEMVGSVVGEYEVGEGIDC